MWPREANPAPQAVVDTAADKSPSMLFSLLSHIPLMLRVAILHVLRISEQSKYQDLRTDLTVNVLRSFLDPSPPHSVSSIQKMTSRYPPVRGRIWVSTYRCPLPPAEETGLQDAIKKAIDELRHPKVPFPDYHMPEPAPVEAEWTGYRAGATPQSPPPDLPQRELYHEMMKEVRSPVTVLYFHGGAYWLMDPASHRSTTKTLAKLTGGRVYSVRYRLAPQHPFPAALMDALMSYLALLYPPEGAFHEPVKAEHIVFAGDSAGGNLSLALLQLVLHLHHNNHTISWHGEARTVPLPAGVAVNSPWMDITHSSPSCTTNGSFDYLPTPARQRAAEAQRPRCAAWPATPPRAHVYVADSLLAHPLVTLLLARTWRGAPPTYVCLGSRELLADEGRLAARLMRFRDGVPVVLDEFEGMPHCFALVLPQLREARRCLEGWAGFIRRVVEEGAKGVESRFVTVRAKTLEEVPLELGEVGEAEQAEVEERIWWQVRGLLDPNFREKAAKL